MALKVFKASGGKSADFDPKAEAVRLYKVGESTNAIAATLAVSNNTVCKWLIKAGVQRRSIAESGSLAKAPDPLDVERAVKLYSAGRPAKSVAEMMGVSKATVQRWLDAAGIQPRPRSAPPSRAKLADVKRLSASGLASQAIALKIGVSKATVTRWLRGNTPETPANA